MDLNHFLKNLENCPCGKVHTFDTEIVEIGSGLVHKTGEILAKADFPKDVLLVADQNTIKVSEGLLESLNEAGFHVKQLIYENMMYARVEQVREVEAMLFDVGGVISVGTGSLNDICRVAAYEEKKQYCIFATAPSMDGFASDTAPIIENNFKSSWQAAQPRIIIGDTAILAKAPVILKSSGFGDMIAKYIGLVDWHIARMLIDEYYCENVAAITKEATDKIFALADRITEESEEAAGAVMEALVMTGLAMKLAGCSRPASGTEHVVSHYLECHKVIKGIWPDFHGRKVGVATVYCNRIYRNLAERVETIHCTEDKTDWEDVFAHYDEKMLPDVKKLNNPTITDRVDPKMLEEKWPEIRKYIFELLPENDKLIEAMQKAGAPIHASEVGVSDEFMTDALRYHNYMRYRLHLPRLFPMMGIDAMDYLD
ncbi:MAG: iron-containing alcohol dehydrogenase [Clostridia bacterium]|nr:iron-containing alcohol dehydrogenase [Clostridia bacterium]